MRHEPTWSSVCTVGDSPPCTQKMRLSMSAERLQGRGCKGQVLPHGLTQTVLRGCTQTDGSVQHRIQLNMSSWQASAAASHLTVASKSQPGPEEPACGTVTAVGSIPAAGCGCSPEVVKDVCAVPPHID